MPNFISSIQNSFRGAAYPTCQPFSVIKCAIYSGVKLNYFAAQETQGKVGQRKVPNRVSRGDVSFSR